MTPLAEAGASLADSVADVAGADVISVTVLNDEQVRDVVGELAANAKPGTVIAIHSTISPSTAVELAEELQPQGIHIVDAPVSGSGRAANKGELAIMVGATDEAFELIKEPFSKWASLIIHAGEPGAGTRMKLARNMLHFISFAAACEASKLAEAAGVNLQDLGNVVRHTDAITGGAGSIMFRDDMKPLTPDHFLYQPFLHARGLGEKDLSLALALGDAVDVDLPLAEVALKNLAAGLGVPTQRSNAMDELRKKGLEKMNEVYGWEMPDMPGEYFALTVDHLFGTIWSRPGLSMRDRRMMLIGVLAAQGMEELLEVQGNAILHNEEMTREELREIAIFLTHYVGFPLGSKVDGAFKRVVAKRKKAEEKGAARDSKDNVNDAVQMHVGRNLHDK